MNLVLNRARSKQAFTTARLEPSGDVRDLQGRRHCLVVSYRRDGTGVPTPVWFGRSDHKVYFRSAATDGKIKRIQRHSEVLIAPCTARGRPLAPPFRATARILAATEEVNGERFIQTNFGVGRRLYERLLATKVEGVYVEMTPMPASLP